MYDPEHSTCSSLHKKIQNFNNVFINFNEVTIKSDFYLQFWVFLKHNVTYSRATQFSGSTE